jgi:hypothetical protein
LLSSSNLLGGWLSKVVKIWQPWSHIGAGRLGKWKFPTSRFEKGRNVNDQRFAK